MKALVAFFVCLVFVNATFGATYSIVLDGPTSAATFTPFSIDVYLHETLGAGESTLLGDPDVGLISGTFQVEIVSGSSTLLSLVGNPAFDNNTGTSSAPWIVEQFDSDPNDGTPTGSLFGSDQYRLLLGRIYGFSSSVAERFELRIVDRDTSAEDVGLGNGDPLDSMLFPSSSFSLNVTSNNAIPEPSTCAIFVGGIMISFRRILQKRFLA